MELALFGGGASSDQGGATAMRIKLHFKDRSILGIRQLEEGLSDSWFLVRPNLRSVADLASDIVSAFNLLKSCPYGICLLMEDFTLPPSQPICLLKDKDVVCVNKKVGTRNLTREGIKYTNSSSLDTYDKIGLPGVPLNALEEFERELGGYESEKEEDVELRDMTNSAETRLMKSKKKKRKRAGMESIEEHHDKQLKLQVVPYTGVNMVKKSKKEKTIVDMHGQEEMHETKKNTGCKESERNQEHETSKVKKKKKHSKGVAKEARSNTEGDPGKLKKNTAASKSLEANNCTSTRDGSSSSEKSQDDEGKSQLEVLTSSSEKSQDDEGKSQREVLTETEKKLSRSTLRKKAKRRWKREHQKELATQTNVMPSKFAAWNNLSNPGSVEVETKDEDDGEAEEERLPIVVKPGHIRFEPPEEDEVEDGKQQHTSSLHTWNSGISKRKGQSWGQEKTKRERQSSRAMTDFLYQEMINKERQSSSTMTDFMDPASQRPDTCDSEPLEFEKLPQVEYPLQNGDIIAYRLVELGSSFCPELSEYRVGMVVHIDDISGTLKLGECKKYPLKRILEGSDAEINGDLPVCSSPYDEEGNLEIERLSLVDVRMVEKSKSKVQVSTEVRQKIQEDSTRDNGPLPSNDKMEASRAVSATTDPPNSSSQVSPSDHSAWQEISKEIDRRKEELAKKAATESHCIQQTEALDTGKPKVSFETVNRSRPWLRRAGGLGATMAMLRAQVSSES